MVFSGYDHWMADLAETEIKMAGSVTVTESPLIIHTKVAEALVRCGYALCNSQGCCNFQSHMTGGAFTHYGLLSGSPVTKPSGILKRIPARHAFVGLLSFVFYDGTRALNPWKLEVYGKSNLGQLKHLAEQLSREFDVKIEVELKTENERLEAFLEEITI